MVRVWYYGLGGLVLGIAIGLSSNFQCSRQNPSPLINNTPKVLETAVEDDFLVLGRTTIMFNQIEKTGENQYRANLNGKHYKCAVDLENKKIEVYFGIKR